MKNTLVVFFIFFFVLSIIVFPFKIRILGHFNVLKMIGFYSLKLFFIKFLTGRMIYENGKIKIENSVNIIKDEFNPEFTKKFIIQILERLDVKKIEIYFTGGIIDNSFSSAMICGSVSSMIQSFYSYLSQKYYNLKLYEDIDPTFNENNLEITFDIVVSISLFSISKSVFVSLKKDKKELKDEKW